MPSGYKQSCLSAAVMLAFSGQVMAMGLGELQTSSSLGEVLQADISLLRTPSEKIESSCFRLVRPEGDLPWLKQGSFSVKGNKVILAGARPLAEPILQVGIQVTCGHDLLRTYTLMPSPPVVRAVRQTPSEGKSRTSGNGRIARAGETPASVAAEFYPDSRSDQRRFARALVTANRHLGLRSSWGTWQKLPEGAELVIPDLPPAPPPLRIRDTVPTPPPRKQTPAPAVAPPPSLTLPAPEPGGDRLVLSGGEDDVRLDAALRMDGELAVVPTDGEVVSEDLLMRRKLFRLEYRMLAFLENQAETASLPPTERLKALETVFGEVAPPASVSTPPVADDIPPAKKQPLAKPAPSEKDSSWLWEGVLLALIGAAGTAWWAWQRRRERELIDHEPLSPALMDPISAPDPLDEFDEPPRRTAPPVAPVAETNSILDDHLAEDPVVSAPLDLDEAPTPIVPANLGPESRLDASLDEVFNHNPVMELAEIMMSFGRVKGAAQALQEYIDQNPHEALQPWVKLLDIYRTAGMRDEFERLARNLNLHYNVEMIPWSESSEGDLMTTTSVDFVLELEPLEGEPGKSAPKARTIEELPHICDHIVETWGGSQCQEYIQSLLRDNRGGSRQGFPLPVADELLFLSELLRDESYASPLAPDIDLGAETL